MRKIFKCGKGLSPVVAAIILIAVTVAVSIAVAAWMGALTIGFMATEQISFIDVDFTPDLMYANITIKNTGTGALTVSDVLVNGESGTTGAWIVVAPLGADETLNPNEEITIRIDAGGYPPSAGVVSDGTTTTFDMGANYGFTIVTAKNNKFGPYTAMAQP